MRLREGKLTVTHPTVFRIHCSDCPTPYLVHPPAVWDGDEWVPDREHVELAMVVHERQHWAEDE